MATSGGLVYKRRRVEDGGERYFANPYLKDAECKIPADSEAKESVAELPSGLKERVLKALVDGLPLVDKAYAPTHSQDPTVYTGCTGIALLHFHLATTLYADSPSERSSHLHTALSTLSSVRVDPRYPSFLCGGAGGLAVGAVVHAHLGNATSANQCIKALKEIFTENQRHFTSCPSELLYGHSGYLFALLFVNAHLPGKIEAGIIEDVAKLIFHLGEENKHSSDPSPLMYMWHKKAYLGVAHGFAGILTLLLQVRTKENEQRLRALVKPCIDNLVGLQFPSGNFPSSLESTSGDLLVHWCHGAPGFVHLMALAYKVFGDQMYYDSAVKCGEVVWERGLLRKGCGICHGVAGNAYTFLQLYRMTKKPQYIHRVSKFVEWCLTSSERQTDTPSSPFSLFEGTAGTLYMYAEVLGKLEDARFPCLEVPVASYKLPDIHSLYP